MAQDQTPELPSDDQDVVAVLDPGQRQRLRLAFPAMVRPASPPPEAAASIDALEQTLRDDLNLTGIFEVQGPPVLQILELTGDQTVDFELYRSLNNEVVLLTEAKITGQKVVLEGRIYDLVSGRLILGKRYRGTFNLSRRIAHTFADEIVLYFTGRRGIALSKIAFTSDRDGEGLKEIYLMDYDGVNQRRITGHRSLTMSPDWSPSGSGLAYVSYFEGPPSLYFVDQATGRKSPVLVDNRHSMSPAISPDGKKIVFSRSLDGNTEIFVIPRQGGEMVRLTNSRGIDTNPAWSPSGREIAFTSDRSGTPQIYLMDAEGTNVRRVTYESNYNDGAIWHPDGNKLLFSSREKGGGRFDVAMVDLVTLESQLITGPPGSHEAPSISPDGRKIVFESSRAGSRQIFVMDLDGRNLRQLTSTGRNFGPSWSNYLK